MKKIMIVDDNVLSVEGIEKNIDWELLDTQVVLTQYDGHSAIEALKKQPVDIIISDIEMPDLDGITMSKLAITHNPFIKVILISAHDRFDYARRAIRIGVYDYIEKPIDYEYLAEKIQGACNLIDQEQRNMELINASRPAMIEKFFHDLMRCSGKEAAWHLSSYMDYLKLELSYSYCNVAVFHVENAAEMKAEIGIPAYEMQLYNIHDTICMHCQIFDKYYLLKEFDELVLLLFQNTSNVSHFMQVIHKTAAAVIETYQHTDISLNIGIGNPVSELWNMRLAYESAIHALEYRFFFPQKNIFDTKEALGKNLSLEPFSDSREDELIRLICQKDYPVMEQWIKDFSVEMVGKYQEKSFIFVRIYSLLGRILKFLYELNIQAEDLEAKIIQTYSNLNTFSTSQQFFSWLYDICSLACQKLDASLKNYHDQLCESVLSYIRENYENSALNLNEIARHANVSPAYLSALYKKNQKISLSDTITSTRIEAACQYLKNSNLSLKEISEKCGYANQYYFSTSFKKKMGISPSAYRESV